MRFRPLLLLSAMLVLPALLLRAEATRFWRQETFADFQKGRPKGVALRSDGVLLLAPRSRQLADPNLEILWAVVEDKQGNVYLGGGSPARVLKIDPAGTSTVLLETKELEVRALVLDPASGALYAATSPDGSVYRVARDGSSSVVFNPNRKYLWDLVRHPSGALFLATGDRGEIFRIQPDGKGDIFFTSGETHVRSLALDAADTLYAGTEPNGLVLRISPAGEAFVLYEMPRKEVTAMVFGRDSNLYVAAIGQKMKPPAAPPPGVPGQPQVVPGVTDAAALAAAQAAVAAAAPSARIPLLLAGGSDIYRIAPDGYPEALWSSPTDLVYSLAFAADGRLLAGTGNQGRLLALDSPAVFTTLLQTAGQQITTMVASVSGRVYFGTANPGKLLVLEKELEPEGSYESDVFDADIFSQWGRISWQGRTDAPAGTVQLSTRSGNTSDPQKNWSAWSEAYAVSDGTSITSPPARFLQWRAVLRASDSRTPSLAGVTVAYLRRNKPPVVDRIIIQAPGVGIRSVSAGSQPSEQPRLEVPQSRDPRATVFPQPPPQPPQRIEPPPQATAESGARSVLWSAFDENDDTLVFSVYYRGETETRWKLMKENVREKFVSWDGAALPDGAYFIRVLASDSPSNPPELALTGENVSDRFEVDNTPPRIDDLTAVLRSAAAEVRFVALDSYSTFKKAEYSFDAGPWTPLFPDGGTLDAREHRFLFRLDNLSSGEHTVVVRVFDRFDNPALAKSTFTVK